MLRRLLPLLTVFRPAPGFLPIPTPPPPEGVALALAVIVWLTSTQIGPASVDWETVDADSATRVRIDYHSGTQRWWAVRSETRAAANVSGEQAAVETRLVLPSGFTAADSLRFVIGITVDGLPENWHSLTATLDTSARLGETLLGDRDRIEFMLTPGPHLDPSRVDGGPLRPPSRPDQGTSET